MSQCPWGRLLRGGGLKWQAMEIGQPEALRSRLVRSTRIRLQGCGRPVLNGRQILVVAPHDRAYVIADGVQEFGSLQRDPLLRVRLSIAKNTVAEPV